VLPHPSNREGSIGLKQSHDHLTLWLDEMCKLLQSAEAVVRHAISAVIRKTLSYLDMDHFKKESKTARLHGALQILAQLYYHSVEPPPVATKSSRKDKVSTRTLSQLSPLSFSGNFEFGYALLWHVCTSISFVNLGMPRPSASGLRSFY